MPEQMRPASKKKAPDPAVNFDRSDPKKESGQGRMDNNTKATPTPRADVLPSTVGHAQAGDKQLNSEEAATISPKIEETKKESLGWEKKRKT
jgi:hypothetical protein